MEDLNGLEVAWNWFVGVVAGIADAAVWVWDQVQTWPFPLRLIAGGAVGALILIGVFKK